MNPREVAELRDRVARARLARAGDVKILGLANASRRGRKNGRLMTDEFLEAARRSVQDGMTCDEIGRRHWRSLGYRSAESCGQALGRALRALDRGDMLAPTDEGRQG